MDWLSSISLILRYAENCEQRFEQRHGKKKNLQYINLHWNIWEISNLENLVELPISLQNWAIMRNSISKPTWKIINLLLILGVFTRLESNSHIYKSAINASIMPWSASLDELFNLLEICKRLKQQL